ncbi:MAG: hypothetical protein HC852_01740 [Acaryochloridaceae cyanobacterium RU_4_10]|nr:hypothetical protein [Acaryochloridaceae cyanobacterium RU_4_10]
MKTIYVTENKARTIEKVKAKHPLIFMSADRTEDAQRSPLVKFQAQKGESIAYILSPEEFAALSEAMLKTAIVVRE